jgi:hypothetical protein
MIGLGVSALAEGLSGEQRLQVVAVLLGVLVFGVVVLVVDRRNHGQEATPPGMTAPPAQRPEPRAIYRPPPRPVPTISARAAADEDPPANPYPVPFVGDAGPEPVAIAPDHPGTS